MRSLRIRSIEFAIDQLRFFEIKYLFKKKVYRQFMPKIKLSAEEKVAAIHFTFTF